MDKRTKEKLIKLRINERKSYGAIAEELGVSVNTVKSFCLRNDLGDDRIKGPLPARTYRTPKQVAERIQIGYCRVCGTAFEKGPRQRTKLYCSDLCAHRYRFSHPRTYVSRTCLVCGKEIKEIDHRKVRKYCGLDCYRTARYYTENPERTTKCKCETCGKEFELPGHKVRRFCSQECYWQSLKGC